MNGKKAKRLRREAMCRTVGQPERAYSQLNNRRVAIERDPFAKRPGTVVLNPACTRAVYQRMKTDERYSHRVRGLTGVLIKFSEATL